MIVLLPPAAIPSADPILDILKSCKTIAVVGISSKKFRPSNEIAAYLLDVGYKVYAVNPNEKEVLGLPCYSRIEDIAGEVDVVDIFRKAEDVGPVVDGAIRKRAKVVWMQQGIENREAAEKALAAGLTVVMDACILIEHRKRLAALAT